MLGLDDVAKYLMEMIVFALRVILESEDTAKQRIANAYSEARAFAASIPFEDGSALRRVVACSKQLRSPRHVEDVEAAGWMLSAVQERLSERDLPDWESLKILADRAARLLPPPRRNVH